MRSSLCTLPARTKQRCYGNCKHQAILAPALGSPARREIMAFVVISWMLMLSRLYPQALTRDTLTLHRWCSLVNFPSLVMQAEMTLQPGLLIILMTTGGFVLPGKLLWSLHSQGALSSHDGLLPSDSPSPAYWQILHPLLPPPPVLTNTLSWRRL